MAKKGAKQHGINVVMSDTFDTLKIEGWRMGEVTDPQGNTVVGKVVVDSLTVPVGEIHASLIPRFTLEGVSKFLQQRTSQESEDPETRIELMRQYAALARDGKWREAAVGGGGGFVPNLLQIRATEAALGISLDEAEAALRGLSKEERAKWFEDKAYRKAYDELKGSRAETPTEPAGNAIAARLAATAAEAPAE